MANQKSLEYMYMSVSCNPIIMSVEVSRENIYPAFTVGSSQFTSADQSKQQALSDYIPRIFKTDRIEMPDRCTYMDMLK